MRKKRYNSEDGLHTQQRNRDKRKDEQQEEDDVAQRLEDGFDLLNDDDHSERPSDNYGRWY